MTSLNLKSESELEAKGWQNQNWKDQKVFFSYNTNFEYDTYDPVLCEPKNQNQNRNWKSLTNDRLWSCRSSRKHGSLLGLVGKQQGSECQSLFWFTLNCNLLLILILILISISIPMLTMLVWTRLKSWQCVLDMKYLIII